MPHTGHTNKGVMHLLWLWTGDISMTGVQGCGALSLGNVSK